MWKKISSKVVLNHPRLIVREDTVQLPSGKETDYLVFDNSGSSATIIAINNQKKILLLKEYSYPIHESIYQFPGGFVPETEMNEHGAMRELQEESGYRAEQIICLGSYFTNNRRSSMKMSVYLATNLIESSLPGDDEEDIESFWFSEDEIDSLIQNKAIENVSILAAWSLYKARKSPVILAKSRISKV